MNEFKVSRNQVPHEPPFILVNEDCKIKEAFEFLRLLFLRGVSSQTIRAYAFDLLAFYRFLDRSRLVIDILEPQHAADFILSHRREGAAPRTINRRLITVHSFLNSQYDGLGDHLFQNSFSSFYKGRRNNSLLGNLRLKGQRSSLKVKVPSILIMPLSPSEVKRFLIGLRKYRDIAILYLMIFCGLRSCEVLAMEVGDIDLIDDHILVRGKGGKERVLPMSPAVRQALFRYLEYERPECHHQKCFVAMKGVRRGQPLTSGGLRKLFRQQRKKTVKKANPHLFRHTFATNLIQQGVSLPVVQKLLGHSDIEVTMGYVHLSLDDISKEYHRAIKVMEPFDNQARTPDEE